MTTARPKRPTKSVLLWKIGTRILLAVASCDIAVVVVVVVVVVVGV